MAALDESVLWGLVGLCALYVYSANAIELWSPVFWVFVLVIAVWVGKDALFAHFPVWDQWMAWFLVGIVAIFTLNVNFALSIILNAGLTFLMVLFVMGLKWESLVH